MSVSIPYPKTWSFGEILTSSDLNAEFAAVTGITGLTTANLDSNASITNSQLAVGAAVNTAASAAITNGLVITGGIETNVVVLPSITTRGGRVVLFGYGGLTVSTAASTSTQVETRVYRDNVEIVAARTFFEQVGGSATTTQSALPFPLWSEVPSAGAHVYKVTMKTTAVVSAAIVSSSTNAGTAFVIELS